MALFRAANSRMEAYLIGTAYPTATTDTTSNITRWVNDGSQAGASTQTATQRFQSLLTNAANQ